MPRLPVSHPSPFGLRMRAAAHGGSFWRAELPPSLCCSARPKRFRGDSLDYEELAKRFDRFAIEHEEMGRLLAEAVADQPEHWRESIALDMKHQVFLAECSRLKAKKFRRLARNPKAVSA